MYGETLSRICRHVSLETFEKYYRHCKHHSLGFALTALTSLNVAAQLPDQCPLHLLLCDFSGFKAQGFADTKVNVGQILCL